MADGSILIDSRLNTKDFNNDLKSLGSTAQQAMNLLINPVTAATTAVGALVKSSSELGITFEAQMSKVQSISGATATELALLNEKAKEMGAATKFNATESAQAFEYMGGAFK